MKKIIYSQYRRLLYRKVLEEAKIKIDSRVWDIPTHTTEEERCFLYKTALNAPRESVIVEIGSYLGASTCFLAAGCLQKKGEIYAIDTWKNHAMTEGKKDTYQQFKTNISAYKEFITPIRSLSVAAAQDFSSAVDILFVDGDHSYEGVTSDLYAWIPKLRSAGWLLLHDSGWAEGVQRAITEVVKPISINRAIVLPNLYAVQIEPRKFKS